MARVTHVKKARKDIPGTDIKAGEPYYWWKFKNSTKRCSKTRPKPSQLTQSAFKSTVLEWMERLTPDFDDLESELDQLKSDVEDLKATTEESLENMPDGLKEGDTGQLLQERIDTLEAAHDELDSIDITGDFDDVKQEDLDQSKRDRAQEIWDEVQSALGNINL
jgi:predicted RNase H-like nuclease (RuvC/YqgF family)